MRKGMVIFIGVIALAVACIAIGNYIVRDTGLEPMAGTSIVSEAPSTPQIAPTTSARPAATTSAPRPTTSTKTVTVQPQATTTVPTKTVTVTAEPTTTQRATSAAPTTAKPAAVPLCGSARQEVTAAFATEQTDSPNGQYIRLNSSAYVAGSAVTFSETGGRYLITFSNTDATAYGPNIAVYYEGDSGAWKSEFTRLQLHANCSVQPVIPGETIHGIWVDIT